VNRKKFGNSSLLMKTIEWSIFYLAGHGMWLADLVTPVSSTDWNDGKLGQNDGTTDGGGNFLGALHSKANVTV